MKFGAEGCHNPVLINTDIVQTNAGLLRALFYAPADTGTGE